MVTNLSGLGEMKNIIAAVVGRLRERHGREGAKVVAALAQDDLVAETVRNGEQTRLEISHLVDGQNAPLSRLLMLAQPSASAAHSTRLALDRLSRRLPSNHPVDSIGVSCGCC